MKGFEMGSAARGIRTAGSSSKTYLIPASIAAICAGVYLLRRPRDRRSLAGHVALVTGGSRGLGLELARKLAQHQCRLILVARDTGELSRAAQELSYAG